MQLLRRGAVPSSPTVRPIDRADLLAPRTASGAAAVAFGIGLIVFAGWAFDVDAMRRLFVGSMHMLPNTSVGFMAGAVSLWLQSRPRAAADSAMPRIAARALAALVLALGVLTFGERVWGWSAGIDELLFPALLRQHPYRPLGRMATNSTVAFALAGAALLWLDVTTRGGRRPAHWLATAGLTISAIALTGYLYDAQVLYQMDAAAGMAISTALAFFALHLGILCTRAADSWAGTLLGRGGSGVFARRLILAILVVPLALGRLWIQAREEQLMSREVGVAMFVVAVIGILLAVVLRATAVVRAGERVQDAALDREAAARRDAERANRAKSDFLAVMSHELRTPLNAIIGYGSLLADGIPDPVTGGQRRQLDRIGASARHLLALIEEVLTLSRVELGEERVAPTRVALAALVEESVAMVEPEARGKGLRLELRLPADALVAIETDAGKLRQALVNLLGNAVKFTDRGEVRVRAAVEQDGETVVVDVEDTGPGIAPEHLERVFEAFWQVDQAPTRRAGGTGLGLHVTRRLVRLLGGDVTVRSTLGAGSCFTVRLPRRWWGATAELPTAAAAPDRPSSTDRSSVPAS
ncbi:MAG TPA: HAMP domain-containing sensor histidine kinase [Gemmatimonadaceae bacterium]|nr:HAMP domain-containing sensor histidine kinase [Gemmatimonadaceae bacterium]